MYDYLLVGTGLFNAIFAYEAQKKGKKCLAVEKRGHIGGNCYTEKINGINIHKYGAHIFHSTDKFVWDYIRQFAEFNHFVNSPVANYHGDIYNLPFNMNTFSKMWGIRTPEEAKSIIDSQRKQITGEPVNLEEHAISQAGVDVYQKLIKGYTEKQWGRPCRELPKFIINRIPVRYTYDNNYFNDPYQGIPIGGYTQIFDKAFVGCDIFLNTDFNENKNELEKAAERIIYTGTIDSYYNYCFEPLEYRSIRFETEVLGIENYQGVAVVNYTDIETPYTRIIEHKHFEFGNQQTTVISKEYPNEWSLGKEAYYPINDKKNNEIYEKYKCLADKETKVHFGGRLGTYKYFDMQDIIKSALKLADKLI